MRSHLRSCSVNSKKWLFLLLLVFTLSSQRSTGQSSVNPDALFNTIKSRDAKLFDAYNNCDLVVLASMVSDDLEFSRSDPDYR